MKKLELRQIIKEVIREEISNEDFQQQCHRSTLEIRKSANKLIKKIKDNDTKRK
ncbi:hypothetical protein KKG81_08510 [bacterium]|nr:hypothetical protein [bacterium]